MGTSIQQSRAKIGFFLKPKAKDKFKPPAVTIMRRLYNFGDIKDYQQDFDDIRAEMKNKLKD